MARKLPSNDSYDMHALCRELISRDDVDCYREQDGALVVRYLRGGPRELLVWWDDQGEDATGWAYRETDHDAPLTGDSGPLDDVDDLATEVRWVEAATPTE